MSTMPGHEDLKPREVLGIDNKGLLLLDFGEEGVRRYKLYVGPSGGLLARPHVEEVLDNTADQQGERQRTTLAQRLAGIDQA